MKHPLASLFAGRVLSKAVAGATLVGLATAVPGVYAQETSATVRGAVSTSSGEALAGATVIVTSNATGVSKTVTTDEGGYYSVRGLPAGVSYDIVVDANGWQKASTAGLSLAVGQSEVIRLPPGRRRRSDCDGYPGRSDTAVGPNAVFDLAALQDSPSVNRNINDIIQQDPRLYVDQSRGDVDAVQCNGANPRYNSLTVDGVRLNDGFGLNSNGYPTQRMPFPYDAISSVAVELAPMDVVYGGFSACNINAVTKTGSNEFFGSVFFDYGSDSLRGDKLEGDNIESQDYDETRWGVELGGAIIPDKLFFYGAYEKYDGADLNNRGAIGTVPLTKCRSRRRSSMKSRAFQEVYGFEPGRTASEAFDFEDEKYLLKADWYINDAHRLSATYMYNDSFNFTPSDGDLDEFEFDKHFYKRGAELTTYNINWYADWNDRFSTEIRYSFSDVDFLQQAVAGKDFAEFRVELDEVDVYLGQDDSRQANALDWEVEQLVIRGTYTMGNHTITGGFEREDLQMYNLFYQHVDTEIRFDGIENFAAGQAARIYYGNAISNDERDAAVEWGYAVNSALHSGRVADYRPVGADLWCSLRLVRV
ncbi:MAG: hypothetical protein CM15mP84_09750 [Cellvibrionales bacterium]|nr:MAG: hypothetical protein CM15mP84_09750 [Cellvibrionales bacterium]